MRSDRRQIDIPSRCHSCTKAIYRYWLEKCGDKPMPARSDIDPLEMPKGVLPGVCLVDVVSDDRRYVYRLVGTVDVEVRGYDPTGKSVLEGYFGPSAETVLANYDRVASTRAPYLDPRQYIATTGRYVTQETLFLPLSDDGIHVNKIFVYSASREIALGDR
jgi:hypothetical protein